MINEEILLDIYTKLSRNLKSHSKKSEYVYNSLIVHEIILYFLKANYNKKEAKSWD